MRATSLLLRINPTSVRRAVIGTFVAPAIYFLPVLVSHRVLCPDDGTIFNAPMRVAAAHMVLQGELPLWNPYIFSGMPFLGAMQGGILLPLNWVFLMFTGPVAMNISVLATYGIAGAGAFLYSRQCSGESRVTGPLLSALVWQFSGFFIAQIGHTNIIQTACFLPWVFVGIEAYARLKEWKWGGLLASAIALQCFAGHPQTFVYSLLLAVCYVIYMARMEPQNRGSYMRSILFIAAGLVLSAIQILPGLELLRNSMRSSADYSFFSSFSLPPGFLSTFVAPYVWGGGDGTIFRAPYAGPAFYGEYAGYVSWGAVALAVIAVLLRRDPRTRFWFYAVTITLLLALGRYAPFNLDRLIFYVPILNLFRVPARHLMEVDFGLSVLAGMGLTTMSMAHFRHRLKVAVLVVSSTLLLVTFLAVTRWRNPAFHLDRNIPVTVLRAPELFQPLLISGLAVLTLWKLATRGRTRYAALLFAVIISDLVLWGQFSGWRTHSPLAQGELWRPSPVTAFLDEREAAARPRTPYRILTYDQSPRTPDSVLSRDQPFLLALQPDVYMIQKVQNAAGYDGFGFSRYERMAGDMKIWGELPDPGESLGEDRAFDLLNVRYLVMGKQGISTKLPSVEPKKLIRLEGMGFLPDNLKLHPLKGGSSVTVEVPGVTAGKIGIVSDLSYSTDIPEGAIVGRITLGDKDGRVFNFPLRAGVETAEWAHDRPDLANRIRHNRATVAETWNISEGNNPYQGHSYISVIRFPRKLVIRSVSIAAANMPQFPEAALNVLRLTLASDDEVDTFPLPQAEVQSSGSNQPFRSLLRDQWRFLATIQDVSIFENTRSLPRAWIAAAASSETDEKAIEIIRTGRFPDGSTWDPYKTALVENSVASESRPGPSGFVSKMSYNMGKMEVEASTSSRSILVLSENFFPGWRTYVDHRTAPLLRVDYNLRGVLLEPGTHRVTFVYWPNSFLMGSLISLLGLSSLLVVTIRRASLPSMH